MPVTGTVGSSFVLTETSPSNSNGITAKNTVSRSISNTYDSGTAASQVDVTFARAFTLAAGGTNTHDLVGVLVGAFGNTVTMAKVRAIQIENTNTVAGDTLTVGGGTNPWIGAFASTVKVGPSGFLAMSSPIDGFAVTASTGDIVTINNPSTHAITYVLSVAGTSA